MITELALLRLRPGSGPAFERAFAGVAQLLVEADGYLRHRLLPTLEHHERPRVRLQPGERAIDEIAIRHQR